MRSDWGRGSGACGTLTLYVPEILILRTGREKGGGNLAKYTLCEVNGRGGVTHFIMGAGLVTPPLPPWPSCVEGQHGGSVKAYDK